MLALQRTFTPRATSTSPRTRLSTVRVIAFQPPSPSPNAASRPSIEQVPEQGRPSSAAGGKPSLAAKLGGREALVTAADLFYKRLLADSYVADFFASTDIAAQRAKQVKFLSFALGGAEQWRGKSMFEAHEHLALNDSHFDVVAGHLNATLVDLGVPGPIVADTMAVVENTREQVLGRAQ